MKIKPNLTLLFLLFATTVCAQQNSDIYKSYRQKWLETAEKNKPVLTKTTVSPQSIITVKEDAKAFQNLTVDERKDIAGIYSTPLDSYRNGVIVDFGTHITGHVSFALKSLNKTPDAPLRLKFTFGETLAEVTRPIDPYTGTLSRAWFQDETVTVSVISETTRIPRRVSFRYAKIEVVGAPNYKFAFDKLYCEATTSAATHVPPLADSSSDIIRRIDSVGLRTLSECMQTVYEDGPKRDRRLWIGDLYLEALANSCSFRQNNLTKRCLYLLAGVAAENGVLNGTMFEQPYPHAQKNQFLLDYSYLYNVALLDYLKNTNDTATAKDLWPVARRQARIILPYIKKDNLIDFDRANREWWIFIDWKQELDKEISITGLVLFALEKTYELAVMTGNENDVEYIPSLIDRMRRAAHKAYYDKKTRLFVNPRTGQRSYMSQVWATLGKIASAREAVKALTTIKNTPDAVTTGTPYAYHYYIQALIDNDLNKTAKEELQTFWSDMINKGADTFWEAYDRNNDFISPYKCHLINSYCHAWSCTPVYFIRTYPEIFQ